METGALHTGCISEVVSETVCFSNAQNSSDEARPSEFNTLHSTIVIAAFDGVDPKISSFVLALYTNRASAVLTDNLLHPHLNIAAIYPKFSVFFSSPPTTQEDKRTTPTEHITKYCSRSELFSTRSRYTQQQIQTLLSNTSYPSSLNVSAGLIALRPLFSLRQDNATC
jgi:hypothetical protein